MALCDGQAVLTTTRFRRDYRAELHIEVRQQALAWGGESPRKTDRAWICDICSIVDRIFVAAWRLSCVEDDGHVHGGAPMAVAEPVPYRSPIQ